jgi:integrase
MKPIKWKNGYRMSKQVNGVRKYFYGSTAKESKRKYEAYNGNYSNASVLVLTGFDNYMTEYVSVQSKSTYAQYDAMAKQFILPVIGRLRIERVIPFNIQNVLTHARKIDGSLLSESTLKTIRKVMHGYFEYERRIKRTIKENPCTDITIPKVPRTKEKRAATPEELKRIWIHMAKSHYFYCFQFLLITGIRPSEACGLKYSDIKQGKISISETRTRHEVTDGKTRNAKRLIDVTPAMLEIINMNKMYLKSKEIDSDYLFPTKDGFPSNSGYITHSWCRLKKGTDITLSLYELRHTYISLMIDKLPLKDLQRIVGHSSRMDTSTTYAHSFQKENNNSEIIDSTMSEYLPKIVI